MIGEGEPPASRERLAARAQAVTITRDVWGIAHVHGRTDSDAVFGMIYAQAEDDFHRIEANYLTALGRSAEADLDPAAVWSDLRARLFVDPDALERLYRQAPAWLQGLMEAWADGLNHFLLERPDIRPQVIQRFEPWMPLAMSEGANNGDLGRISLAHLAAFYGSTSAADPQTLDLRGEGPGSNGIALAPAMTRDGFPMLLINPHTAFYLRSEMQVSSDEGLNAYGAATWGQFFIYHGFNATAGWMHTTSSMDNVDEFAETMVEAQGGLFYLYGGELRPVVVRPVALRARTPEGGLETRVFEVLRTHHGPIVRWADGKPISVSLMDRPLEALAQGFLRTKARSLSEFQAISKRAANSTNNTIFADAFGAIAFLSPQFVPRRDDRIDFTQPVDGANPACDWQGDTPQVDLPAVINPAGGWVYNANDGPWWAAGAHSPKRGDFPRYMDRIGANCRTAHALEILETWRDFTPERLRDAAYDPYLHAFARLLPGLVAAFEDLPAQDARRLNLARPIGAVRDWDCRSTLGSVATSLAVGWGETLREQLAPEIRAGRLAVLDRIESASGDQKLTALTSVVEQLTRDFGSWEVPWSEVNRYQRIDAALSPRFDDARESWPVPYAASQWGALAAYGAARQPGARRMYGTTGNSFVAVVEFGPTVRAFAVSAGGASGHAASPHFADQSERFALGHLRPVYFHPEDLAQHALRRYRPGQGKK